MIKLNKKRVLAQVLPTPFVSNTIVEIKEVLENACFDEQMLHRPVDVMVFMCGPRVHALTYQEFFDALHPCTEVYDHEDENFMVASIYKVVSLEPLVLTPYE